MPGLHLRQTGFTYSGCRLFSKHHLRIIKIRKAGDLRHLGLSFFTHDVPYFDSKDVAKRII